ncbi:NAD(P)/FAD-dependent oxidoreductase [Tardiphaga sp.]|uniref:NAD(P)/FAD-dependent oxidoreductase n=1 Tax=Tardiphaga sp. TaxID=1926292 RepID=UPI0037D9FF48
MSDTYDCVVIGGGPAGLMAAIYLARFRRTVMLFDAGSGRAATIPRSHNVPGFVDGLSGQGLLYRMFEQTRLLNVPARSEKVVSLTKTREIFRIASEGAAVEARSVVMATGIVDRSPVFDGWREAIRDNLLGFCPVCDAFEARHKRIAVVGPSASVAGKALFLRAYSSDVSVIVQDTRDPELDDKMSVIGVQVHYVTRLDLRRDTNRLRIADVPGDNGYDIVYPAMGADARSDLAVALGADHKADGSLRVDDSQRTSVEGLYAIGDVVTDIHQISVASGHAAVATCTINTALPRRLQD